MDCNTMVNTEIVELTDQIVSRKPETEIPVLIAVRLKESPLTGLDTCKQIVGRVIRPLDAVESLITDLLQLMDRFHKRM